MIPGYLDFINAHQYLLWIGMVLIPLFIMVTLIRYSILSRESALWVVFNPLSLAALLIVMCNPVIALLVGLAFLVIAKISKITPIVNGDKE